MAYATQLLAVAAQLLAVLYDFDISAIFIYSFWDIVLFDKFFKVYMYFHVILQVKLHFLKKIFPYHSFISTCSVQYGILKWHKSDEFLGEGGGGYALYWILLQNNNFFLLRKILKSL